MNRRLTRTAIQVDVASVHPRAGIATVDRSGRSSAFGAVAQIAGRVLGPALSAEALSQFGYGYRPFAVAGVALIDLWLFALAVGAIMPLKRGETGSEGAHAC